MSDIDRRYGLAILRTTLIAISITELHLYHRLLVYADSQKVVASSNGLVTIPKHS